jgi:hypothetical protein
MASIGGTVSVQSQPGEGSTFTLAFPVQEEPMVAERGAVLVGGEVRGSALTI